MAIVSIVKYDGSLDSVRRAVEMCGGLEGLDRGARVLIKPNITYSGCVWMPPYGMVTTSVVVEGLLSLLAEHGCTNVSIAEGAVLGVLGSHTGRGFTYTGIDRVARRFGARLIDLNEGPFETRVLDGVRVGISRTVLDADFLINVPVLKTHSQVKVSLGFKNLKGCIDIPSRKAFHHKGLDRLICLLNQAVRTDLTVIDGIYTLEKGPDALAGIAHRKNLIVASRDPFACDCVGAAVMGIDPSQVGHLREYALANGLPTDVNALQIAGEDLNAVAERIEWELDPGKDLIQPAGITGLSIPHPGERICSGCYSSLAYALAAFSRGNPNLDLGGTTIYCGRNQTNEPGPGRIVLYGNCAISSNRTERQALKIAGCPPGVMETLLFLMNTLVSKPRMVRTLVVGGPKMLALRVGLYSGDHPRWKLYRPPEFDRSHFRPTWWQEIRGSFSRKFRPPSATLARPTSKSESPSTKS